ncbi:hypothetical protein BC943DRAFT_78081 [Umbelopsis sp. AD052]|nr:hypothetical protein BC943DRAFT_78081 [Umbelopsis sp. AD052]
MLRDSEDRLDHLKDALSYTSLKSNMMSKTQPSIAPSTPNTAAPNEVDRKIPSRQSSLSKSRETNAVDGQLTPPATILETQPKSRVDPSDEQLPTIMSDNQFAQILTSEPDQLSSFADDDLLETSVLADPRAAITNPSPRPTIDSMQSNDTFFSAVSKDESVEKVQDENEDAVESEDIDYETASTVSSRSTIKQSIHSHETLRTPSPPSRSTSLPVASINRSTSTDDQTPAQAIAQLVRGRTVNSSPSSEHQSRRQKPPSAIEIPESSQTVPRIEEHLASPTSIPSEFLNRNAKSVDFGLLMERPVIERRKRSIRRDGQSSRSPPTSPQDKPSNSIASTSAISIANDIYIPISPHPYEASDDEELLLKRDTVLCTKSVTAYNREPTMYKASVASRNNRMKGKWREYDLVLTNKRLELSTNKVR